MSIIQKIEMNGIIKQYKKCRIVYPNIVIDHKITCLLGKNGSGKSTLLKILLDSVHYEGSLSRGITYGYMPEYPAFPIDITLRDFLSALLPNQDREIDNLLKQFNIVEKQDELLKNLSKGMKAKVSFIQAYLQPCDYILLDEPASGLDKEALEMMIDLLNKTSKRAILTTHQIELFSSLIMDVIKLD